MQENIESEVPDESYDLEANSLIIDTEISKKQRIESNNSWPTRTFFDIENIFRERISSLSTPEGFRPIKLNYSSEKYFQRSVAYILDTLDFLPFRPDLAFDFIWRAIDFLSKQTLSELNIPNNNDKETLKNTIEYVWKPYFTANSNKENILKSLLEVLPTQSTEYLFKRLYAVYDETRPNNPNKEIARIIGFDGGQVHDNFAHNFIQIVRSKYSLSDSIQRRKGSRLLYRFIQGHDLHLDSTNFKADASEQLNFLINGILYTFRNDRAHGGVFSPSEAAKHH